MHAIFGYGKLSAPNIIRVSKYGFGDTIVKYTVVLDPSHAAAQIVSGIGFIGGGVTFVQRDMVRGLTTAAIIWLTAAVAMACGAGLRLLALLVTAAHFLAMYVFMPLAKRILFAGADFKVQLTPGAGAVERVMHSCAGHGFAINKLAMRDADDSTDEEARAMRFM